MSSTWRGRRTANDRHFLTKLILRCVSLASFVLTIILTAALNYQTYYILIAIILSAGWFVSLAWNFTWIVVMCSRERLIRPGLVVAFDLLAWLGLFGGALTEILLLSLVGYQDSYSVLGGLVTTFALIGTIAHFWIFVYGCREEERRRKLIKAEKKAGPKTAGTQCVDKHSEPQLCARCQCHLNPARVSVDSFVDEKAAPPPEVFENFTHAQNQSSASKEKRAMAL